MKRRQRERAQTASIITTRKRKSRRTEPAAYGVEDVPHIPDLNELLCEGEAASMWWKENGEQLDDSSLEDLLQELVSCDESVPGSQDYTTGNMAPAASHRSARCGNKNAQAARLNRLRKKEYVSGLEDKVARLSEDNQRLERERRDLGERVNQLEEETRYLRAVLANDSALSQLLGRLTGPGGVKLSTSLFSEREKKTREHDYALPAVEREPPSGGGVCLHVDKEKVSVEFCPTCSRRAAATAKIFFFRCLDGLLRCRS